MLTENDSWDDFYRAGSVSTYYSDSGYYDSGYYGGRYGPGHNNLDRQIEEAYVYGYNDGYALDPDSWHQLQQNLLWNMDVSFQVWDGNYTAPTSSQTDKEKCEADGGVLIEDYAIGLSGRYEKMQICNKLPPIEVPPAVCAAIAAGISHSAVTAAGAACTGPVRGGICVTAAALAALSACSPEEWGL
jgi:hypothetical protein